MEIWKPLVGFEGLYEVSSEGFIRSIPRNGTKRMGRTLSRNPDNDGYLLCKIRNKNDVRTAKIHREVAKAFLPNPENKPQVNHKNGDKADCRLENLEWVTNSENIRHAKDNGLQCECPNRVAVHQILNGQLVAEYQSLLEAQQKTGIGWTGISAVIRGLRKNAGGFQWERVTTNRKV